MPVTSELRKEGGGGRIAAVAMALKLSGLMTAGAAGAADDEGWGQVQMRSAED